MKTLIGEISQGVGNDFLLKDTHNFDLFLNLLRLHGVLKEKI